MCVCVCTQTSIPVAIDDVCFSADEFSPVSGQMVCVDSSLLFSLLLLLLLLLSY